MSSPFDDINPEADEGASPFDDINPEAPPATLAERAGQVLGSLTKEFQARPREFTQEYRNALGQVIVKEAKRKVAEQVDAPQDAPLEGLPEAVARGLGEPGPQGGGVGDTGPDLRDTPEDIARMQAELPKQIVAWHRLAGPYGMTVPNPLGPQIIDDGTGQAARAPHWQRVAAIVSPVTFGMIARGELDANMTPEQWRDAAAQQDPEDTALGTHAAKGWLQAAFGTPTMKELMDTALADGRSMHPADLGEREIPPPTPYAQSFEPLTPEQVDATEMDSRAQFESAHKRSPGREESAALRELAEQGSTYEDSLKDIPVGKNEQRVVEQEPTNTEWVFNKLSQVGIPGAGNQIEGDAPLRGTRHAIGTLVGSLWNVSHRDLAEARSDIGGLEPGTETRQVSGWEVIREQRERAYRDFLRLTPDEQRAYLKDHGALDEGTGGAVQRYVRAPLPWEASVTERTMAAMFGPGGKAAGEFLAGMAYDLAHDKTMVFSGPGKTAAGRLAKLLIGAEVEVGTPLWKAAQKLTLLQQRLGNNIVEKVAREQYGFLRLNLPGMDGGVSILPQFVDDFIARQSMRVGEWVGNGVRATGLPLALTHAFASTAWLHGDVKKAIERYYAGQARAEAAKGEYRAMAQKWRNILAKRVAALGRPETVAYEEMTHSMEWWATHEQQLIDSGLIERGGEEHLALQAIKDQYAAFLKHEMQVGVLQRGLRKQLKWGVFGPKTAEDELAPELTKEALEYITHLTTDEALEHIERNVRGATPAQRMGNFLFGLKAKASGAPFAIERSLKGSIREINAQYAALLPEGVKLFHTDPVTIFLARAFQHVDAMTPATTLKGILSQLAVATPKGVLPSGGRIVAAADAKLHADNLARAALSRAEVFRHFRQNPQVFVDGLEAGKAADWFVAEARRQGRAAGRLEAGADEALAALAGQREKLEAAGISSQGLDDVLKTLGERKARISAAELRADAAAGGLELHAQQLRAQVEAERQAVAMRIASNPLIQYKGGRQAPDAAKAIADEYLTTLDKVVTPVADRLQSMADAVRAKVPRKPGMSVTTSGADALHDQARQALDDLTTLHASVDYLEHAAMSARGAGFDTASQLKRVEQAAERMSGRATAAQMAAQAAQAEAARAAVEGVKASAKAARAKGAAVAQGGGGRVAEKAYRDAAAALAESGLEPRAVAAGMERTGNAPGMLGDLFTDAQQKLQRALLDMADFAKIPNEWEILRDIGGPGQHYAMRSELAGFTARLGKLQSPGALKDLTDSMGFLRDSIVKGITGKLGPHAGEASDWLLPGGKHTLQGWWVRWALLPRLAWSLRNGAWNFWVNGLSGVQGKRYEEAFAAMNGSRRIVASANGEVRELGDLAEEFRREGILHGQSYRAGIKTALDTFGESTRTVLQRIGVHPITGEALWQRMGRMGRAVLPFVGEADNNLWLMGGAWLGKHIEEHARLANALQRWMEGASTAQIRESVASALFDYRRKGELDAKIQAVAPFYMWFKNNTPQTLRSLYKNTAQWSLANDARLELSEPGTDPTLLPRWAREGVTILRGIKDGNLEYYALGGYFAGTDPLKMLSFEGAKDTLGQLISPPWVTVGGMATGYDPHRLMQGLPARLDRQGDAPVNRVGGELSLRAALGFDAMPLLHDANALNPGEAWGAAPRLSLSGLTPGKAARMSLIPFGDPAKLRSEQEGDASDRALGVVFGIRKRFQPLLQKATQLESANRRIEEDTKAGMAAAVLAGDRRRESEVRRGGIARSLALRNYVQRIGLSELLQDMERKRAAEEAAAAQPTVTAEEQE